MSGLKAHRRPALAHAGQRGRFTQTLVTVALGLLLLYALWTFKLGGDKIRPPYPSSALTPASSAAKHRAGSTIQAAAALEAPSTPKLSPSPSPSPAPSPSPSPSPSPPNPSPPNPSPPNPRPSPTPILPPPSPSPSLITQTQKAATSRQTIQTQQLEDKMPVQRRGRSAGSQMVRQTSGGTLYSWGLSEARLARKGGDNSIPEPALPDSQIISISASRHSAVATAEGHVWTMGHNNSKGGGGHGSLPMDASGQLGRDGTSAPGRVLGDLENKFVVQVTVGRYHSLAITDQGQLFSWGLNDWGQLGRPGQIGPLAISKKQSAGPLAPEAALGSTCTSGSACHDGQPRLVTAFKDRRIVALSAGRYNCLALDDQGNLHSWGYDGCGNGGVLPPRAEAWKPRAVVGALVGKRVVAFDSGYTLWIAVTDDGQVYTCAHQDDGYAGTLSNKSGWNGAGQLGRDTEPLQPGLVTALQDERVVAVAAGREHAVVATKEGSVFTWGGRDIVAGRRGGLRSPGRALGDLANDTIVFVAAGEYFSLAASLSQIYGWGGNDYLCTGVGRGSTAQVMKNGRDRGDVPVPSRVGGPLARPVQAVLALAAGFQHSMAIVLLVNGTRIVPGQRGLGELTSGAADHVGSPAAQDTDSVASKPAREMEITSPASNGSRSLVWHTQYAFDQASPPLLSAADRWAKHKRAANHQDIVAQSPDVFAGLPAEFDPKFTNPCWYNGTRLRCIPLYHIIGVSKCGTTDLYHRLSKHPHMFESLNKGPHWWDECSWPLKGACTTPPNGDFEGYIDLYRKAAESIAAEPLGITGEASSNTYTAAMGVYLRGPSWNRDTKGVTMPDLLYESSPWLRLVLIFRNPVDRYYSAFYYYRWGAKTEPKPGPDDFHITAVREMDAWTACVQRKGHKHCLRHYNPQQLIKGMYSEFLDDWLRVWPRDQLLIFRNEDYKVSQQDHMMAMFTFLGLRNLTTPEWAKVMDMPVRNKNSDKYPPMRQDTRELLNVFYATFNTKLASQMQDSRFLWLDKA